MKFDEGTSELVDRLISIQGDLKQLENHINESGIDYENKGTGVQKYDVICVLGMIKGRLEHLLNKLDQ